MIDAETQPWFGPIRRLSKRGVDCRGLAVDLDGVSLGPDLPLIRRTSQRYRVADSSEISLLVDVVFGGRASAKTLTAHLSSIAKALNSGDVSKALILGLYFPIGELTERQLDNLRRACVLKRNFNPDEPRDERGRWTSGPAGTATPAGVHSEGASGRINDPSGEGPSTARQGATTYPSLDEAAKAAAPAAVARAQTDPAENHEYFGSIFPVEGGFGIDGLFLPVLDKNGMGHITLSPGAVSWYHTHRQRAAPSPFDKQFRTRFEAAGGKPGYIFTVVPERGAPGGIVRFSPQFPKWIEEVR